MLRYLGCALVLLLTHPTIASADLDTAINILPARMHVVPTRSELAKTCGTDNRVFGCTVFVGEKLTYSCTRQDNAWQMRPAGQFVPYIYMLARNIDGIAHEKLHIEDIRRSLAQYLSDLASRTFESEEACTTSGDLQASLFNRRMDEWKVQSNLERHPELRRAAK